MNFYNLARMSAYLQKISDSNFNMATYNVKILNGYLEPSRLFVCNSPACVIGHCININLKLAKELLDEIGVYDQQLYTQWSTRFTGINSKEATWHFLFSGIWKDRNNTVKGAIERLNAVINRKMHEHKDYGWFVKKYTIMKNGI